MKPTVKNWIHKWRKTHACVACLPLELNLGLCGNIWVDFLLFLDAQLVPIKEANKLLLAPFENHIRRKEHYAQLFDNFRMSISEKAFSDQSKTTCRSFLVDIGSNSTMQIQSFCGAKSVYSYMRTSFDYWLPSLTCHFSWFHLIVVFMYVSQYDVYYDLFINIRLPVLLISLWRHNYWC